MSLCKIIGVGGAGCNLVAAICSAGQKSNLAQTTEYVYLDLGTRSMLPDQFICNVSEIRSPITKIVLAPHGSGGRVNAARVAALRNIDELKAKVGEIKAQAEAKAQSAQERAKEGVAKVKKRTYRKSAAAKAKASEKAAEAKAAEMMPASAK